MADNPSDIFINQHLKEQSYLSIEDVIQNSNIIAKQQDFNFDSQILPNYISNSQTCKDKTNTKSSSRRDKNKSAVQKYRQKRKNYTSQLEFNVSSLEKQLSACDEEIKSVKQKLKHLISSSKNNNEHTHTYDQLSTQIQTQEPDLDKINLLLDTLKYRIGANGRQRQAKIDYYFKQIVNTIFPALHRYLMLTANKKIDMFGQGPIQPKIQWTKQLFNSIKLNSHQQQKIKFFYNKLQSIRSGTIQQVNQLNRLSVELKSQQETCEEILDEQRRQIHPVQSAHWVLFCEKYKYRQQISLNIDFDDQLSNEPRKMVKLE